MLAGKGGRGRMLATPSRPGSSSACWLRPHGGLRHCSTQAARRPSRGHPWPRTPPLRQSRPCVAAGLTGGLDVRYPRVADRNAHRQLGSQPSPGKVPVRSRCRQVLRHLRAGDRRHVGRHRGRHGCRHLGRLAPASSGRRRHLGAGTVRHGRPGLRGRHRTQPAGRRPAALVAGQRLRLAVAVGGRLVVLTRGVASRTLGVVQSAVLVRYVRSAFLHRRAAHRLLPNGPIHRLATLARAGAARHAQRRPADRHRAGSAVGHPVRGCHRRGEKSASSCCSVWAATCCRWSRPAGRAVRS